MTDQELIVLPKQDAMQVFTTAEAIDPYLKRIRNEIDAFEADITTATGRKQVASMARRVARAKTYLDGVGKELADEVKQIPKKIDATRKRVRDTLDAWKDEVRKPLTEWEEAEAARVERHKLAIREMESLASASDAAGALLPSSDLKSRLASIEAVEIGGDCEEFEVEYARTKDQAQRTLRDAIQRAEAAEAERAELERLRREREEQAARERDEAIRREAAERAKAEAEARAKQEAERAEAAAKAEREAAERRELELKWAAEAAERRAAEAEQRAKREADETKRKEEAEAAAREADKQHRAAINGAAVQAFVKGGIEPDIAKQVVTLIAQKAIPAVSIRY